MCAFSTHVCDFWELLHALIRDSPVVWSRKAFCGWTSLQYCPGDRVFCILIHGRVTACAAILAGLYTEILPRGGAKFGV